MTFHCGMCGQTACHCNQPSPMTTVEMPEGNATLSITPCTCGQTACQCPTLWATPTQFEDPLTAHGPQFGALPSTLELQRIATALELIAVALEGRDQ